MFLDEIEHWAAELRKKSSVAQTAGEFLQCGELVALGDVLLNGAFIARRFLEEAKHGRRNIETNSFHFARDAVARLLELKQTKVHLKGCMFIDMTSHSPELRLDAEETLPLYDFFSQIIHADPIQLWKSPNMEKPCFWFASQNRARSQSKPKFYRIGWAEYADLLKLVAYAAHPLESV